MRQFAMGLVVGLLVLPAIFLVSGLFGLLPTKGTATPPPWEMSFARHALHTAAAREAGHPRDPIAPTEANLRAGMKLFRGDCAGCHGTPDRKTDGIGLYPLPPRFADDTPKEPVEQLFWIVKYGVRYSGMFAFGGGWKDSTGDDPSDEKIWTVVTFLHNLDSLPPAVAADWRVTPRT